MQRRAILQALKIIGILLFLWILSRIGWRELLLQLRSADRALVLLSMVPLILLYVARSWRWHLLVRGAGLQPSFYDSWKLFNIGAFLAMITPAKIGEVGRAAYLHKKGLHGPTAIALSFADRIADILVIGALGVIGLWILFGTTAFGIGVLASLAGCILLVIVWTTSTKLRARVQWLRAIAEIAAPPMIATQLLITLVAWALYFWWAILLGQSLGITVNPLIMVAVYVITGILSLLPIAPSGLGTRDAALITLLAPYGVDPARAVALASLMFITITVWSVVGAIYWVREK